MLMDVDDDVNDHIDNDDNDDVDETMTTMTLTVPLSPGVSFVLHCWDGDEW